VPDFKLRGAVEVRQAANAFNNMRQRIRRQINQRTEMLAGVSHDLRTPLTRMKLQLAMLGDTPEAAELKADVAEMEKMVEGYLEFARGEETEAVVPTDLNALLSDVVDGARRAGGKIELNADGTMNVPLRPAAFKRCVANVVANAVRYADHVVVGAAKKDNRIEITIDDDGPGIPENQWQEVFRPFRRLESSRNVATGGVGLGLTIARDVMHGHGGSITLDQSPTGGLRACLRLPL
jgi:two-component system osmolarity sensor histidine kinase EnvZ